MDNERTFTQTELDQIIAERLRKERAKLTAEAQQRETELNRREALLSAKEDWSRRGLPVELLDTLDVSKDGALDAAAAVLENMRKSDPASRGGSTDNNPAGFNNADPIRSAFGLK